MDKITNEFVNYIIESKKITKKRNVKLPSTGEKDTIILFTADLKEKILFDISRGGKIQLKIKMQNRYNALPIIRLDIDAPPHMNYDGTYSSRNHLHIYNAETRENDTYNLEELDWFDITDLSFISVFNQFCLAYNIDINNVQGVL